MANPRFVRENHIFSGATLTASSELNGFGTEALEDQLRQYFWRTATGWTIIAGFNNRIDFNRGGAKVAIIAAGTYATGALLATAIDAAFTAADATPSWTVTYSGTTNRFTIQTAAHAFVLLWATGANLATSAGRDVGFVPLDANGDLDPTDSGSATSHTGTISVFQGRHNLVVELTTTQYASIGTDTAVLIDHNLSASNIVHSVKLQSAATNAWTSPTTNEQMNSVNDGGNPRRIYFTDPQEAFYRLYVDDVTNPDGYFQLGKFILGKYVESPFCFSVNKANSPEDFSDVTVGIDGTHFHTRRRKRAAWSLEILEVPDPSAELITIRDFLEDLSAGDNVIFDFNPGLNTLLGTDQVFYGYFPAQPVETYVPSDYWSFSFGFLEAL